MNPKMKKFLIGLASVLLAVALIAVAPVSRIVYGIYDANRTKTILKQLEAEATAPRASRSMTSTSRPTSPPLRRRKETRPLRRSTCWS